MLDIDNHEKEILAVGYKNKKIETEDKLNQLNLIDIQYLLGTNHRLLDWWNKSTYQWVLYWIYDESKFEYKQSFQRASEGMFEKHILYINHGTYQ